MNGTVAVGCLLAVGLFWSIGAYNRLMRLRSQAMAAFAAVDAQFKRCLELGRVHFQSQSPVFEHDRSDTWEGFRGALVQLEASLKAVRIRPLDASAMGALQTACDTLGNAWNRLVNGPPDLAGAPLPALLQQEWHDIARQTTTACDEFNGLLSAYNMAIAQFPARVLAWLFGFRAGKILRAPV